MGNSLLGSALPIWDNIHCVEVDGVRSVCTAMGEPPAGMYCCPEGSMLGYSVQPSFNKPLRLFGPPSSRGFFFAPKPAMDPGNAVGRRRKDAEVFAFFEKIGNIAAAASVSCTDSRKIKRFPP